MLTSPLNLPKWLKENSHLLKPPINNYCVYNKDVTVMIVGGPNARTDYHINRTAEWFYQYRGSMLLKIVDTTDNNTFKDIIIGESEMFLLPPNTPHNPIRFADTVGIVLEQARPENALDTLRWYCKNEECRQVVYEESFYCYDLGSQIKTVVERFAKDERLRRCERCGTVAEARPLEGEIEDPNLKK